MVSSGEIFFVVQKRKLSGRNGGFPGWSDSGLWLEKQAGFLVT
jgi:hypothetical protein